MSTPKLSFGILSSLFMLCLGVSIQAQPNAVKAQLATVSGQVMMKEEPARGMTVLLQGQQASAIGVTRASTDENGKFRFVGVVAGSYSIFALAPGYITPGKDDMERIVQSFNIGAGEKIENIRLEIRRGAVIAGRVIDSQGRPVIEETLNLQKVDRAGRPQAFFINSQNYEISRTDDRGLYRIFGLPEGRYLISVGQTPKLGSANPASSRVFYPLTFYPNASTESDAKVIDLSAGAEAADIDITIPNALQTFDIHGLVMDADSGRPISGVAVFVGALTEDVKTGKWGSDGERSNSNGEFHFLGLAPGRYTLVARHDSNNESGLIGEPTIIDLTEDDLTGVEVKLRQGGSISGVAVIEGTSDPNILSRLSQIGLSAFVQSERFETPGFSPRSKVKGDGSFQIRGLQSGKAYLVLTPSEEARGLLVARIERDGAPSDQLELGPGEHMTGVRVVMIYGTNTIRGELKFVGAAPPPGLRIMVRANRQGLSMPIPLSSQVDAQGQFTLENAAPGDYEIRLMPFPLPNRERLDPQITQIISSVRAKVVLAGANPQPVVLVIDLPRKEGNQ